ncbi:adenosine deaminase, putative [Entamoeba dispar SAW760]|uniref:Adenosine deaminase, putative n=1 Tax=Entamoeba dispar (strain ATCC PRA-260 / SAW760) TaxID=370354 RepID=B0EQ73_ENTDS|nr:adenosine deaminase, putative [Entamoeba dispar SAW760]EDR23296.1 adenosine deaminase, putative [Entamoeba dispar SAW760]|eukprot:EDR23296.1 adenosine deaminase, putative [Entamoeba dispar SAW760]
MDFFIQQFPKVELHSHLNGSIREDTLKMWHQNANITELIDSILSPETSCEEALSNCFKSFDLIYEATNSLERIKILAMQVLEDYDNDNTIIAEIRTTPRKLEGHSQRDYIDTVVNAFEDYIKQRTKTTPFYPYLILSINRSRLNDANETIELASEYQKKTPFVRGIELSGNPFKGTWKEIVPLMEHAKELDLPITMHIGEKVDDEECVKLIECYPLRVGHGIFLNKKAIELMHEKNIGCEVCLTSNMVSRSIKGYDKHPMMNKSLFQGKVFISCDDRGLFRTSMVNEMKRAIQAYCHNNEQEGKEFMKQLCLDGIQFSFLSSEIKQKLRDYVLGINV